MATTSSEPAGDLERPPPGGRTQLAAAYLSHHKRFTGLPTEIEGDGQTSGPTEQVISFGLFRLFPARRLLLEGDRIVRIGDRALDLLIAFVERPGELISKPELIAKVWPHTFVEECNLKVQIAALRRALGDGQAGNRYISTIAGRGYCFVAPVIRSAEASPTTAQHSAAEPLIAGLDWSYRPLTKEEHRVLRRLSLLADRFAMEAAAVVADSPTDMASLLILLSMLSNRKLERRFGPSPPPRGFASARGTGHPPQKEFRV
ncbi:winged helix-turn-helix domain-containing protein [Allomesorhizobium camelthorni]|uniref:Transcriptional regulator n=1 Tax=Allomesorhizobium camelthorni TaxID=475069 RepID=A0A6G4WN30_9HYPH|nr:transcriptional regulator [Mesorhizobium camelthorni]NGO56171.1 transcriptional regulator [Mesorhizobium camelthorni]